TVDLLLVMRVVQGIGGGFGMVLGRAVLIDMTDGPELFRIMNIMQGVGGIAPIVAPLLGGLILLVWQWREIFLAIAVISLGSLLASLFLIARTFPLSRLHVVGFRPCLRICRLLFRCLLFVTYPVVNAFSVFPLMSYVSATSFVVKNMLGFSETTFSNRFAFN